MHILNWRPPYDWQWMLNFLRVRAVNGIENVTSTWYERSFSCNGHRGIIRATPDIHNCILQVTLSDGLKPVVESCLARVTRLFDLDCEPELIGAALGNLGSERPGLRLPGSMDAYEQGIRAILSQLVRVSMAVRLTSKVVALCGEPLEGEPSYRCFPTPERLADVDLQALKALGIPITRAVSLIHFARSVVSGAFPVSSPANVEEGLKALQRHPGIGRWTASYIALRGWQEKDIFLPDDYLIKKRFAGMTPAQISHYAERWQPWRSYALLHIWYADNWTFAQPS